MVILTRLIETFASHVIEHVPEPAVDPTAFNFLKPYIGADGYWSTASVEDRKHWWEGRLVMRHAISLTDNAYVALSIRDFSPRDNEIDDYAGVPWHPPIVTLPPQLSTEIRLGDIMIEGMRETGGDPDELRLIAVNNVSDEESRASIYACLDHHRKAHLAGDVVELNPDNALDHSFIEKVPAAYAYLCAVLRLSFEALGRARVGSVIFIEERVIGHPLSVTEGEGEGEAGRPIYHIVLKLVRGETVMPGYAA